MFDIKDHVLSEFRKKQKKILSKGVIFLNVVFFTFSIIQTLFSFEGFSYLFISTKQVKHLSSVDEIIDFLHEVIKEDSLAEAEAQISGYKTSQENIEIWSVAPYLGRKGTQAREVC